MSSEKLEKSSPPKPKLANFDFAEFQNDPQFPIFVAIAVVLATAFIFLILWYLKKGSRRQAVLICGPCDSGKTLLFSQMLNNTKVETFTSMKENIGVLNVPGNGKKPVVIDLPGHERIRYKCLDKQKDSAMGIIYLLDAATITKGIRDATEFLFRILSDPTIYSNRTPVLVICNKQDMDKAKAAAVIERELAKEIGLLRETHAGNLQGTDGSTVNQIFLGKRDKDFSFADLKAPVDFCETSVLNEDNLDQVQAWISSISC